MTTSRARGCGRRGTYILCGMQGSVSRGTHRITAHMSGDAGEVHGGLLSGRTIAGNGCEICLMELPGLSFERPGDGAIAGKLVVQPAGASSAGESQTRPLAATSILTPTSAGRAWKRCFVRRIRTWVPAPKA